MNPRDRALLLFGVGLLLVLNPVYLFPGGVPARERVTYRAERVERPDAYGTSIPAFAVLDCSDGIAHRECVQATRVGYDGTLRVDTDREVSLSGADGQRRLYFGYEFVRFEAGYARPNATVENGTLVLSYDSVSKATVMKRYAYPYDGLPSLGKRAVRNGTATATRWVVTRENDDPFVDDDQRFVVRDGTFYQLLHYEQSRRAVVPRWTFDLLRIVGVVGGLALAFLARERLVRSGDDRRE
ncbi:MAG: hypothetical protein ABEI96_01825 [Haloarculaceae archaeon]